MKKYYATLFIVLFTFNFIICQTTDIPDLNFERFLVKLGLDDKTDRLVLTSNISGVTSLDIRPTSSEEYVKIKNLTGIEAFTSLETLICDGNALTTLDVSNNLALKKLNCALMNLTSLIVKGAINLESIYCNWNQLPEIDVSENLKLDYMKCWSNRLTSLDLSFNTKLDYVDCGANNLTYLNVKNGNNSILTSFDAKGNPALSCIEVDDEAAANAKEGSYTSWENDDAASFSEDCSSLGIDDNLLSKSIHIIPNPISNECIIKSENIELLNVEIYSILGKKVKTINSNFNNIQLDNLTNGVYFLKIYSKESIITKKIIKK